MSLNRFKLSRLVAALLVTLPQCTAQPKFAERDFTDNCRQAEAAARSYLATRGFTEPQCSHCPNSLRSPKSLLDAKGKSVGTLRIRRELTVLKTPFWLWSSPLHASIFLQTKPLDVGCRLGLWIDFESFHTMVAVIFPVGENLGLPSNGKLESDYLDAIQALVWTAFARA
jgi:hypothetical protein